MANTSAVYARIDTDLKKNAENILSKLGISPSSAIQMLYSQIVLTQGLPFELRLPSQGPTSIGGMSDDQIENEIIKGIESMQNGDCLSANEVDEKLKKKFGI